MSVSYHINQLIELAAMFENNAEVAQLASNRAPLKTDKRVFQREAVIWRQAANIVRQTQIDPLPMQVQS